MGVSDALPWLESDCCSARADMVPFVPRVVRGAAGRVWLFLGYGPISLWCWARAGGAAPVICGRARENPAFGSEMLLGCSCSLAAQMPAIFRFELFWVVMKLLRDCGRSARSFFVSLSGTPIGLVPITISVFAIDR